MFSFFYSIRLLPLVLFFSIVIDMPERAYVIAQEDFSSVLPPTHSVVPQLYATGFEFAEGPALNGDGTLYVVNYRGLGKIGSIAPDGTAQVLCDLNELAPVEEKNVQANGLKVDAEGRLIVADTGAGRLLRIAADGSVIEVLADRCDGVRFNAINDVALDPAGNIYFSDPGGSSLENPIGSIYRYDIHTKRVTQLDTGLAFPNGLAITPDLKHLCVAESSHYRLLIYDLADDGTVSHRKILIEFPAEDEGDIRGGQFEPDGLIMDSTGRIYVAMWTGGVINVVETTETEQDMKGEIVRQYDAGGPRATNCHFHGPYLYTTIASKEAVFRLQLNVDAFDYNGPQ